MEPSNDPGFSFWHAPGILGLLMLGWQKLVGQHSKRIKELENNYHSLETRAEANAEREIMKQEILLVKSDLSGQIDGLANDVRTRLETITRALLK